MLIKLTHYIFRVLVFMMISYDGMTQGFNPGFEKKHDYPIRAFFNKFSVNLSTGYGRTYYRHTLRDYSYLRNDQGSLIIPGNLIIPGDTLVGYSNWFSGVEPARVIVGDSPDSETNGYKLLPASDTTSILMKGGGYNIPLQLSVYYNLFRLRLGGGVGLNFHNTHIPQPENFLSRFPEPGRISSRMSYYYLMLGYSVYEFYDNAIGIDIRVGKLNRGSAFDKTVLVPSNFVNFGVSLEKVVSEYFRMYVRPAYEIKSYTLNMPVGPAITHQDNAFYVTLGMSINYPDLPRSPIKNDKIQMRHYIADPKGNKREFRGQPLWRKQDPKIGELYPELIKAKRKRQAKRKNFFKKKN